MQKVGIRRNLNVFTGIQHVKSTENLELDYECRHGEAVTCGSPNLHSTATERKQSAHPSKSLSVNRNGLSPADQSAG
jgi:hypothetical protein